MARTKTRNKSKINRNPPYTLGSPSHGGGKNGNEERRTSAVAKTTNVHFLKDDEFVPGISRLVNLKKVKELRKGPEKCIPLTLPVQLNKNNIKKLEKMQFVVAPKPLGVRYWLYVDLKGSIFLQKSAKHAFQLSLKRAPQLIPNDTILDGIVVRKLVRDEAAENNQKANGKLTFVIMDAIRCHGVDLTRKNIQERLSTVLAEIIEPRLNLTRTNCEVFGLDITQYEPLSYMEEYLSQEFKDSYKYPLGSFIFLPILANYRLGKKNLLEWDVNNSQECSFRLKVSDSEGQSTGDLLAFGPWPNHRDEIKYSTIDLTDELMSIKNGSIIECRCVDSRWNLVRVRTDRNKPNVVLYPSGKMKAPVTPEIMLDSLKKIQSR